MVPIPEPRHKHLGTSLKAHFCWDGALANSIPFLMLPCRMDTASSSAFCSYADSSPSGRYSSMPFLPSFSCCQGDTRIVRRQEHPISGANAATFVKWYSDAGLRRWRMLQIRAGQIVLIAQADGRRSQCSSCQGSRNLVGEEVDAGHDVGLDVRALCGGGAGQAHEHRLRHARRCVRLLSRTASGGHFRFKCWAFSKGEETLSYSSCE